MRSAILWGNKYVKYNLQIVADKEGYNLKWNQWKKILGH